MPPAPHSPARAAPASPGAGAGMHLLKRQGAKPETIAALAVSSGAPATPPTSWAALLNGGAPPAATPASPSAPAAAPASPSAPETQVKKESTAALVVPSPAPTPPVASPRSSPPSQQPTSPTGAPPPLRPAPWAKRASAVSSPIAEVTVAPAAEPAAAPAVAPTASAAARPPLSPRSFSFQRGAEFIITHETPPVEHPRSGASGGSTPKAGDEKAAAPPPSAAAGPALSWAAKAKAVAAIPAPKPAPKPVPKPAPPPPRRADAGHGGPRSGPPHPHAGPRHRRGDEIHKSARQAPPAKPAPAPAAAAAPPPPPTAESVTSEDLNSTLRTHQLPSVSSASSSGAEALPPAAAPARVPSPPPPPPPPPPPLPSNEALELLVNADVDVCWQLGAGDAAASAVRLQPRGIKNPGNLCFVNAVLQGLMGSSSFCRLMEALRAVGPALDAATYPILAAMAAVAAEFERRPAVAAAPPPPPATAGKDDAKKRAEIVSVLGGHPMSSALVMELIHRFAPRQADRGEGQVEQEDAHEFLHFLLDKMNSELLELRKRQRGGEEKGTDGGAGDASDADADGWLVQSGKKAVKQQIVSAAPSQEATAVTALFEGKLATCVACAGAPNSVTVHPFQIVPLNIYSDAIRSIDDALEAMTAAETLPDYKPADNAAPREAAKSERFLALPDLLVLHLMRFQFTGRSAKISKHVAFEPRLAMRASWLAPGCPDRGAAFDLVAAVTHHGKSIGSGHYTADAVQPDGSWLRFDDADVYCVKEGQVLADRPYMLVYQRRQK